MTGRFARLEFGHREGEEPPSKLAAAHPVAVGTPVRTAEHYALQADEAYRTGRFEAALQLYTRALRDDRGRIAAWVGQVQMLVQLGEHAEARLWSDKALELFKNNGELLAAKGQACLRMGDGHAARVCSDASLQSQGTSAWRWEVRGETLLAKEPARARDCFDKALAEPGADWFDRLVVARIYLFHRHAAAALEFAQAAVGLRPAHAYAWLVLADCQRGLGWSDHARASLERCLELRPDDPEARAGVASLDAESAGGRFVRRLRGWLER